EMSDYFQERLEAGEDLSWAGYKKTSIQHLIPNFKAFSYFDIHTGGGRGIINATSERHGASWRMVVELGDEIKAFGIYPGASQEIRAVSSTATSSKNGQKVNISIFAYGLRKR